MVRYSDGILNLFLKMLNKRNQKNGQITRVTDICMKAAPVYSCFCEVNCNTWFGKCADIGSYLCKFKTNWHQILGPKFCYILKVACMIFFI